ncbi:MarR family winged helix-turn-helix transcriptional regulator [Streptococcus moroccensis]|uniref:DNA-binding MarR family transcriptional regulator n=1 Tax=Streptococcus moroccensis TaxID=1451356 RepID=A0ABT9YT36_9STRE|nr:MarR family transcriptional regulator [Streptococcus moroccensis]MDQ0223135.1 DNA-binding MarR family transcriptional regulator [Streptococcus moroccensis]
MKKNDIDTIIEANRSALNSVIALRRTVHTITLLESPLIKQHGITLTQFGVLEILYNKGDLRIQDLIDKMLTTSGNMTVVIKNMIRDGLITRQPNPLDKRACLISLTDKGRAFIETILPDHYQNVGRIFSVLTDEEQDLLVSLLKKFKNLS